MASSSCALVSSSATLGRIRWDSESLQLGLPPSVCSHSWSQCLIRGKSDLVISLLKTNSSMVWHCPKGRVLTLYSSLDPAFTCLHPPLAIPSAPAAPAAAWLQPGFVISLPAISYLGLACPVLQLSIPISTFPPILPQPSDHAFDVISSKSQTPAITNYAQLLTLSKFQVAGMGPLFWEGWTAELFGT